MNAERDDPGDRDGEVSGRLAQQIDDKARRRLAAREGQRSAWFGLGMFGLVGWSIALPTVLGLALGRWLDRCCGGQRSWALTGLMAGIVLGCMNAWYWVERERTRD